MTRRKPVLDSGERGGQDAADRPNPSVQAKLAEQHRIGQLSDLELVGRTASTAATIARS